MTTSFYRKDNLISLLNYYLNKVSKNGDCLEWTGALNSEGYARSHNKTNTNLKVHREVYRLFFGEVPNVVRHTCDNRKCINPDHLLNGTQLDNIRDKLERCRGYKQVLQKEKERVFELQKSGKTYNQIAQQLNIKEKRVGYILTLGG